MSEPFTLEYTVGSAERVAQQKLLDRHSFELARNAHVWRSLFWLAICLVGLFSSIRAKSEWLAMPLALTAVAQLVRTVSFSRYYKSELTKAASGTPISIVRLRADELGLTTTIDGIDIRAPWPAVESYAIQDNTLFIKLGAGLWSIVPLNALDQLSSSAQAEFLGLLRSNSVLQQIA